MAGRAHGEPGQPVGIVIAIFERVEWACEPIAGVREFCGEFFHHFGAHFIAAATNSRAERGDTSCGRVPNSICMRPSVFSAIRCAVPRQPE